MSGVASVYATFANEDEARRIGRAAIEERLAACVNILGGCHSIYRWEGTTEEAQEVAAIFKTDAARASDLLDRIVQLHSYDVPAVTMWAVEKAPAAFARWVEESTVSGARA